MDGWTYFWCVICVSCCIPTNAQDDSKCVIQNYEASCVLNVMAEHVEASALVNHCHTPVDITFRVVYRYGNDSEQRWQYTFVTSNQNERVLIPGLVLPPAPDALVYLFVRIPEAYFDPQNQSVIAIEASFVAIVSEEEWEEVGFLDDIISIDSPQDCIFTHKTDEYLPWIVGMCSAIFVFGTMILGVIIWHYRQRKIALDNLALVTSLDATFPSSRPYQIMGPEGSDNKKRTSTEKNNNCGNGNTSKVDANSVKNYLKSGFSFGRLKEEEARQNEDSLKTDKAVVIGNPTLVSKSSMCTPEKSLPVLSNPAVVPNKEFEEVQINSSSPQNGTGSPKVQTS